MRTWRMIMHFEEKFTLQFGVFRKEEEAREEEGRGEADEEEEREGGQWGHSKVTKILLYWT